MFLEKTEIEFKDFETWVNKAPSWLGNRADKERLVCIDTYNEKCTCGGDFHKARDRKSFPVKVYKIVANDETNNAIVTEKEIAFLDHISELIFGSEEVLPYNTALKFSELIESLRNRKE